MCRCLDRTGGKGERKGTERLCVSVHISGGVCGGVGGVKRRTVNREESCKRKMAKRYDLRPIYQMSVL